MNKLMNKIYSKLDSRKYNIKVPFIILICITILLGGVGFLYSAWLICIALFCIYPFALIYNRSDEIEHYVIGTDLNTNNNGDVIELYLYAYRASKDIYQPIATSIRQLDIFVNISLLNNLFNNLGYEIIDDMNYNIRIFKYSETEFMREAKMNFQQVKEDLYKHIAYGAGSLRDSRIEQPKKKKRGFVGKLWGWWTFQKN